MQNIEDGIVAAYVAGAGGLVNADLAAGAAIGIAKIAGYPTDATKFLRGDATWAVPSIDWQSIAQTLTYSTTDGHTFVVTTGGVDLTGTIPVGARIRLTHSATTKYFIATAIDATTITLYGGTTYTLAASAITAPSFSQAKTPLGFPLDPLKWTEELVDVANRSQATPTQNTWYNAGALSLAVPIGSWLLSLGVDLMGDTAGKDTVGTLSTANNTESDSAFTSHVQQSVSGGAFADAATWRQKHVLLAAKTSYFVNIRTTSAGMGTIYARGDLSPTIIRAVCAYL